MAEGDFPSGNEGLDWREVSGSPFTGSNSTSHQFSISDRFDMYKFVIKAEDQSGSGTRVEMTINGDTGSNYTHVRTDGSETTGNNGFRDVLGVSSNNTNRSVYYLNGVWNGMFSMHGDSNGQGTGFPITEGENGNVSSPLDTFSLVNPGGSSNFDVRVEVYGRDTQ